MPAPTITAGSTPPTSRQSMPRCRRCSPNGKARSFHSRCGPGIAPSASSASRLSAAIRTATNGSRASCPDGSRTLSSGSCTTTASSRRARAVRMDRTMKALQLCYTSCRRGMSGNAGFQTWCQSLGIQPDERRELERRCLYRPPRDAHPEPDRDEVEHRFPIALRYFPLDGGRAALIRSCYLGRDYSGRWGNFFAHALLLRQEPRAPACWPIDYYEWAGWRDRLTPEEESASPPPALPEEIGRAHV